MIASKWYSLLLFVFLVFSCSSQDANNKPKPIEMAGLKNLLHESYFAKFRMDAELDIKRKDEAGEHISNGHLHIDRSGTSRLTIDQKKPYTMTLTENKVTIKTGTAKPMILDLNNRNHYVTPFREICVIEPNPFRYFKRFHKFLLDESDNDTLTVFIKEDSERPRFGDIRVFIHKNTGYILGINFYSIGGDLGRRVIYKHPIKENGIIVPTDIVMDFAGNGEVVREEYLLKDIKIVSERKE